MFQKKEVWDVNPVLPSLQGNPTQISVYHPLTGHADVCKPTGEYVGTVNTAAIALAEEALAQKEYIAQCWKPCENIKRKEDAIINDPFKKKITRILDRDKNGEWFVKEEWIKTPNPKEIDYKYYYAGKDDYPTFPADAEEF